MESVYLIYKDSCAVNNNIYYNKFPIAFVLQTEICAARPSMNWKNMLVHIFVTDAEFIYSIGQLVYFNVMTSTIPVV